VLKEVEKHVFAKKLSVDGIVFVDPNGAAP
jgi:hypothetical protein